MRSKHFLVVCTAVAILASGCTSNNKPSASGSSGPAGATPSATSSTMGEEDQAVADAEAAYRRWLQVRTSCLSDPANTVSSCFDGVDIGDQLQSDYMSLADYQQRGLHVVGGIEIASLELVSVDLTDRVDRTADPAQDLPEVRTVPKVVFNACIDGTGYDLVDAVGQSQLGPNYSTFRRTVVEVVNYNYPDSAQWKVWNANKKSEKVASC